MSKSGTRATTSTTSTTSATSTTSRPGIDPRIDTSRMSFDEFHQHLVDNPTQAEKLLSPHMNAREFLFQFAFQPYIVDFFNPELMIVVELDGSSHYGKESYDRKREQEILTAAYLIIRIPDSLVFKEESRKHCLEVLDAMLRLVRASREQGIYLTGVWRIDSVRGARTACRKDAEAACQRIYARVRPKMMALDSYQEGQ